MRLAWTSLVVLVSICASVTGAERGPKRGGGSAPLLDPAAAQTSGMTPQSASAARKLYTTKCMRCHKSYDPAEYSQPQWESWMMKMRTKARLSPEQDRLLSQYLEAYRAASPVGRTNMIK
jgi:hypothetical protein